VDKAKPFDIPKREVWEAFKKVKANQGAAGVDGQSIADFEADLSNNLYKLWNRLSSGSYFPPAGRYSESERRYAPVGHSDAACIMHLVQFGLRDGMAMREELATHTRSL
jgi:hypothetical protein